MQALLLALVVFTASAYATPSTGNSSISADKVVPDFCYDVKACSLPEDCFCDEDDEESRIFSSNSKVLPNGQVIEYENGCSHLGQWRTRVDIYNLTGNPTLPNYIACVDKNRMETFWTMHYFVRRAPMSERFSKTWDGRPSYVNSEMTQNYKKVQELANFNSQLPGTNAGAKYIATTQDQQCYLARGHLTPCSDFNTTTERQSTYFTINTFPQWHISNNGNWKELEKRIQWHEPTLLIATGTYGTLTLENTPLYLKYDTASAAWKLPINELSWKAVYAWDMVFVTLNNPFLKQIPFPTKLCPDTKCSVGAKLGELNSGNWLEVHRGFTYCCTVQEFNTATGNIVPPENTYKWNI